MAATSRSGNLISAFSCSGARACSQRTAARPGQEPEREPDALAQGKGPAPRRPRVRRAGHGQRAADAAQGPGGLHPPTWATGTRCSR